MSKVNANETAQELATDIIGLPAELDGLLYKVAGLAKGWYTLEHSDGTTKKARRTSFELLEDEEETNASHKMAATLAEYRKSYVPTLAASGKKSLSNGDPVAMLLSGLDYESVYALAEYWCELATGMLDKKYAHLKNDGMRRMNAGNRLRALYKKADNGDVEEGSKADEFHDWVNDEELRAASVIVSGEQGGKIFLRYGATEQEGDDA